MNSLRLALFFSLLSLAAVAQVPTKVGYQGVLVRIDGTPETGMVTIRFSLHDAETAGNELWFESQTLLLSDGLYSTQLGEVTPLPSTAFSSPSRFLQLAINGAELVPRLRFASVPFALVAQNVSGGTVAASSVKVNDRPVVAIDTTASCNGGDVARWSGTQWACGPASVSNDGGSVSYSAASGGGLELSGTAFSLLRSCGEGQLLKYVSGRWVCASDVGAGALTGLTATPPLAVTTGAAPQISLNLVGVNKGGTGADLSTSGGAGRIVKQSSVGGALSVAPLDASELPAHSHAAADIISGVLTQARGGTGLAATPANGTFLRSNAGTWQAATIQPSDVPAGSAAYIQNQSSGTQTGNFNVSGTGVLGAMVTTQASIGTGFLPVNASLQVATEAINAPALRVGTTAPLYFSGASPSVYFNGYFSPNVGQAISESGYVGNVSMVPTNGAFRFETGQSWVAAGAQAPRDVALQIFPRDVGPGAASQGAAGVPYLHFPGGHVATPWGFSIEHVEGTQAKPLMREYWSSIDLDSLYLSSTSVSAANTSQPAIVLNSGRQTGVIRFGRGAADGAGLSTEYAVLAETFFRINSGCVTNSSGGAIAGTCFSDARFKKDVRPVPEMLELLTQLQPVTYAYKTEAFPQLLAGRTGRDWGLLAQDVERVLPDLVTKNDEGYRSVHYERLPLLTLQALRELKTRNDAQSAALAESQRRITDLERVNARLEQRLQALERAIGAEP